MARKLFEKQADIPPEVLGIPLGEGLGILLSGEGGAAMFPHPGDNQPGATNWLSGTPSSGQGVVIMTNGALGNPLAMEILVAVALEYNWPIVD